MAEETTLFDWSASQGPLRRGPEDTCSSKRSILNGFCGPLEGPQTPSLPVAECCPDINQPQGIKRVVFPPKVMIFHETQVTQGRPPINEQRLMNMGVAQN